MENHWKLRFRGYGEREAICMAHGVLILFLPKFHCELNFIEQCWGHAKSIYRTYPESSHEDRLEDNTVTALESIPLSMMRKFQTNPYDLWTHMAVD